MSHQKLPPDNESECKYGWHIVPPPPPPPHHRGALGFTATEALYEGEQSWKQHTQSITHTLKHSGNSNSTQAQSMPKVFFSAMTRRQSSFDISSRNISFSELMEARLQADKGRKDTTRSI